MLGLGKVLDRHLLGVGSLTGKWNGIVSKSRDTGPLWKLSRCV